jgi:two-component system, LuxR family, sensor kinase FixL
MKSAEMLRSSGDRILRGPLFPLWSKLLIPLIVAFACTLWYVTTAIGTHTERAVEKIVEHERLDLRDEVEITVRAVGQAFDRLADDVSKPGRTTANPSLEWDRLYCGSMESRESKLVTTTEMNSKRQLKDPNLAESAEWIRRLVDLLPSDPKIPARVSAPLLLQTVENADDGTTFEPLCPVVWTVSSAADPETGATTIRVQAFDVGRLFNKLFSSARHVGWVSTGRPRFADGPASAAAFAPWVLHGEGPVRLESVFGVERMNAFVEQRVNWSELNKPMKGGELNRVETVLTPVGREAERTGDLHYARSDQVPVGTQYRRMKEFFEVQQRRIAATFPGARFEFPNTDFQRAFRVRAGSIAEVSEVARQLNHALEAHSPPKTGNDDWTAPFREVLRDLCDQETAAGKTIRLTHNGVPKENVAFSVYSVPAPRPAQTGDESLDMWVYGFGMFEQEVSDDARREVAEGGEWFAVGFGAGAVGIAFLVVSMTRSLRRLASAARGLAKRAGTVAQDRYLRSRLGEVTLRRDEIGQLATALCDMDDQLEVKRKELEAESHQHKVVFESAADGMIVVNEHERILRLNREAAKMLAGRDGSRDDANYIGQRLTKYLKDPELHRKLKELRDAGATEADGDTSPSLRSEGLRLASGAAAELPVDVTASRIDAVESEYLVLLRDVSEREKARRDLELQNSRLEEEVEKRTGELRSSLENLASTNDQLELRNREMERVNRIRSDGLRSIAHELVAPLTGIDAQAQVLRDAGDAKSLAERRSHIDRILRAAGHVKGVIQQLRTMARIETGQVTLERERFLIADCVMDAVEIQRSLFEEKRQPLVINVEQAGVPVSADRQRLRQVFINLISNAHKYSREESPVHIEAFVEGDAFVVRVADRGIGIPEADLPHVFDDFRRASNAKDQAVGLGLGLSISRKLVEAHGGTLTVESRLGEGSTFEVRCPISATAAPSADGGDSPKDLGALFVELRVIVVDSREDRRAELTSGLLELGAQVESCSVDAAEAKSLVFKPEVVLCPMVGAAGLTRERFDRLALSGLGGPPLFVMITLNDPETVLERAREMGFGGVLKYPFCRGELGPRLRDAGVGAGPRAPRPVPEAAADSVPK